MAILTIPYLDARAVTIEKLEHLLDQFQPHAMVEAMWEKPVIMPHVRFVVAYNEQNFFLKFYVEEPYIKAVNRAINSHVYKDSCVEFFFAIGGETSYYNLEFNCAGTCLGQYGLSKDQRIFISPGVLEKIETLSRVHNLSKANLYAWELTVRIPFSVLVYHQKAPVYGDEIRLNFYKCGDELEEIHYLAWNRIDALYPNFHLPVHFGKGRFGN